MGKTVRIAALFSAATLFSGCCMMMPFMHGKKHGGPGAEHSAASAACQVCGTEIKITDTTSKATYMKKTYYFDTDEHLREFAADPQKYTPSVPAKPEEADHGGH